MESPARTGTPTHQGRGPVYPSTLTSPYRDTSPPTNPSPRVPRPQTAIPPPTPAAPGLMSTPRTAGRGTSQHYSPSRGTPAQKRQPYASSGYSASGIVTQNELKDLSKCVSGLETAVEGKKKEIREADHYLAEGEAELAKLSADRQAKLSELALALHDEESRNDQLRMRLEAQQQRNANKKADVVESRNRLAELATSLDAATLRLHEAVSKNETLQQKFESFCAQQAARQAAVAEEADTLKSKVASLASEYSATRDHIAELTSSLDARKTKHNETMADAAETARELHELLGEALQSSAVRRDALNRLVQMEEVHNAHHRRNEDDVLAEAQSAAKQTLSELQSELNDRRKAITARHAEEVTQLERRVADGLNTVQKLAKDKDGLAVAEQQAIERLERLHVAAAETDGLQCRLENLHAETRTAEGQLEALEKRRDELSRQLQRQAHDVEVKRMQTAPLNDVVASINKLREREASYRRQLSEIEQNRAKLDAESQQHRLNTNRVVEGLKSDVEQLESDIEAVHTDSDRAERDAKAEIDALRNEIGALDRSITSARTLGVRLESDAHSLSLEKRRLIEEIEQRKDAARIAAANLLSQLQN